ncbi:MAG TPA: hypothetical protein PKE57_00455 [Cellvibrionaceae bacterium]|nr:hypothetical protein [Cellvibrionaceae bacterium]HMW49973.1 hypothetical protein [Cellvibrionaceae bacterium]
MSGYGLMQMSSSVKNSALGGLRDAAMLEERRNQANQALKEQKSQTEKMSMGTGAATGAMYGAMAGGPVGALIGGGIGLLGGYLLS